MQKHFGHENLKKVYLGLNDVYLEYIFVVLISNTLTRE